MALGAILGGIAKFVLPSLLGQASGGRKGGGRGRNGGGGFMDFFGNTLLGASMSDPNAFFRFDPRQRQQFEDALGMSDQYSMNLQDQLQGINAQRMQDFRQGTEDQLAAVRGLERQAAQDINRSYDAMSNRAAGQAIGSGLGNTTVAPGMRALVERERGAALSRNANAQAALLSGILGQRAAGLDAIAGQNYQTALNLGGERLRPRANLTSSLGQATQYNRPGFLGRLFN